MFFWQRWVWVSCCFFFSSRRGHTRWPRDWSSDVCSSDLGAFVTYLRGRLRFRYGSPGRSYRVVLIATGVVAAVIALNMGFMKSNSRVPYTVYNQPDYTVQPSPPPTGFGR